MKKTVSFILYLIIFGLPANVYATEMAELMKDLIAEHKIPNHYLESDGFHPVTEVALVEKYKRWQKNPEKNFQIDGLDLGIVKCARNEDKILRARAVIWVKKDGSHYPADLTLDIYYYLTDEGQKGPHVMLEIDGPGMKGKYFVAQKHSPADYEWLKKYNPCQTQLGLEANAVMTIYKAVNLFYN